MKQIILVLILFVATGCPVYDPPIHGKDILIHNQTSDFVYVLDSLPITGNPQLFDTLSINDKMVVQKKPNYIAKYSDWLYLFEEGTYRHMKQRHISNLMFYFISPENINKPYKEISSQRLYRVAKLSSDEAWKKSINRIFYYGDSIEVSHEYDVDMRRYNQ